MRQKPSGMDTPTLGLGQLVVSLVSVWALPSLEQFPSCKDRLEREICGKLDASEFKSQLPPDLPRDLGQVISCV